MKIIGVTGSFGTGKTLVASMFGKLGAKVIDADKIAHRTIGKGSRVYKRIVKVFGLGVLNRGGGISRRKLSEIVFADKKKLNRLNRLVHPEVIRTIKREASEMRGGIAVIDAPLLFEAKVSGFVDKVVVVKCSKDKQIKRSVKKFSMKKENVMKRVKSQIPLAKKAKLADFVVDNNGSISDTEKQVRIIWRKFYGNS